jgi:hypothetical protein
MADIIVSIEEADHPSVIVRIETPWGTIDLLGEVARVGRELRVTNAHVQGLHPGALGRVGLNAIARRLIEVADVESIVVEGAPRTTGARKGHRPRPFRFPNQPAARSVGRD